MFRFNRFVPVLALAAAMLLPTTASAIPMLQLGIGGGSYNEDEETTVSGSKVFTLYAYLTPGPDTTAEELQAYLNETYYIAAALTPRVTGSADLGSFSYNGTTVNATADMVYGRPPFEPLDPGTQDYDSGDLAAHGIYDTYFKEFSFKFKSGPAADLKNCGVNVNCTNPINVQDTVGTDPISVANGTQYYMAFQLDTTNLNQDYQVHFDLYSEKFKNGDIDIKNFAPFSHDARSMHAPEPSSILLLGTGAVALALRYRRRRSSK
jgi:hypothetical protein